MGDRACADPASAGPEPGGVAGRYRKRAREFRASDAVDRRARRRLLETPPVGLILPRHCEERSDEAIHSFFPRPHELLRGVYHRARIRPTRWLAMTAVETFFRLP